MYSIEAWELGMTCIVFYGYIVGKVWMYHNHSGDTKKPKSKRVIKRGPEWDE